MARGSVNRFMRLCPEHATPLETLLRLTATKSRRGSAGIVSIKNLRTSRAILARAKGATKSAPSDAQMAKEPSTEREE